MRPSTRTATIGAMLLLASGGLTRTGQPAAGTATSALAACPIASISPTSGTTQTDTDPTTATASAPPPVTGVAIAAVGCSGPSGESATLPGNSPAVPVAGNHPTNISLFNGQFDATGGHEGSWAKIEVRDPALPNHNAGTFVTGWVMDAGETTNNWTQIGWIKGNIGGACGYQSNPVVFIQVNDNGDLSNTHCYPQYSLTVGAYYQFATIANGAGSNCWNNEIYWKGQWDVLGGGGICVTVAGMHANNADAEAAFEFSAPTAQGPYGSMALGHVNQIQVKPNSGNWKVWTTAISGTAVNNDANSIGQNLAYDSYDSAFHSGEDNPAFTVGAAPSSLGVPINTSRSASISATTNDEYDALVQGDIIYTVSGAPSGSSASLSKYEISPGASTSKSLTLTVKVGLLQLNPFTITVKGCGGFGSRPCDTAKIAVTPQL